MVIKSPFKDYYDFVATKYGGGDPKIVYVRNRIAPMDLLDGQPRESHLDLEMNSFPLYDLDYLNNSTDPEDPKYFYLIINGKAYLVNHPKDYITNVNEMKLQPLVWPDPPKSRWRYYYGPKDNFELATEYPFLVELSRLVGAPAFIIQNFGRHWITKKYYINVFGQCPILGQIGMASLITPFQMYQDIAYFVGNTLKVHPDTDPPVGVSNKEKILKAGFDLRSSFRHRT